MNITDYGQPATAGLEGWPLLLTVEEAAELLRISRSAAYELTREYRTSSGTAGLPVIQLGRQLRVPREALVRLIRGQ